MTTERLPDATSVLQTSAPFSAPPPSGRRAFGPQRRMSPQTVAQNIARSIIAHRQLGQDRPIRFYTDHPDIQALVQARLNALVASAPETALPEHRYRRPAS